MHTLLDCLTRILPGRWMHLSCMRVMNETEAVQPWQQEPLSGICDIKWCVTTILRWKACSKTLNPRLVVPYPRRKWAQKCMVCGTSAGACVQCHAKDCENMFHVSVHHFRHFSSFFLNEWLIWFRILPRLDVPSTQKRANLWWCSQKTKKNGIVCVEIVHLNPMSNPNQVCDMRLPVCTGCWTS